MKGAPISMKQGLMKQRRENIMKQEEDREEQSDCEDNGEDHGFRPDFYGEL